MTTTSPAARPRRSVGAQAVLSGPTRASSTVTHAVAEAVARG